MSDKEGGGTDSHREEYEAGQKKRFQHECVGINPWTGIRQWWVPSGFQQRRRKSEQRQLDRIQRRL